MRDTGLRLEQIRAGGSAACWSAASRSGRRRTRRTADPGPPCPAARARRARRPTAPRPGRPARRSRPAIVRRPVPAARCEPSRRPRRHVELGGGPARLGPQLVAAGVGDRVDGEGGARGRRARPGRRPGRARRRRCPCAPRTSSSAIGMALRLPAPSPQEQRSPRLGLVPLSFPYATTIRPVAHGRPAAVPALCRRFRAQLRLGQAGRRATHSCCRRPRCASPALRDRRARAACASPVAARSKKPRHQVPGLLEGRIRRCGPAGGCRSGTGRPLGGRCAGPRGGSRARRCAAARSP